MPRESFFIEVDNDDEYVCRQAAERCLGATHNILPNHLEHTITIEKPYKCFVYGSFLGVGQRKEVFQARVHVDYEEKEHASS